MKLSKTEIRVKFSERIWREIDAMRLMQTKKRSETERNTHTVSKIERERSPS